MPAGEAGWPYPQSSWAGRPGYPDGAASVPELNTFVVEDDIEPEVEADEEKKNNNVKENF